MTIHLLRHARAGRRSAWTGDDDQRPLTKIGLRQADALVPRLEGLGIARIVASPYVRCRQSVEPLANRLRLPVDLADALAEGAGLDEVLRLVEKIGDEDAVLCTHGDVMLALLGYLRAEGIKVRRRNGTPPVEKGSVWELTTRREVIARATYHPPPRPGRD